MSADGVWNITVNSPMGPMQGVLTVKTEGSTFTGSQTAQSATSPVTDGKIAGDTLTWSNKVGSPFPMTLEFTGKLDGDSLNGSVKAGSFGAYPFTGARA